MVDTVERLVLPLDLGYSLIFRPVAVAIFRSK